MPFKSWAVGEEVLAVDFNTYVANQVVAAFDDADQRTAQLPAPLVGQLSTLDNFPGAVWIYNGTDWVEPTPYSQSGHHTQTVNGGAGGSVDYPRPFAAGNVAVHMTNSNDDGSGGPGMQFSLIAEQNSAVGFGFIARHANGTPAPSEAVSFYWTAIGFRGPTI